MKKTILTFALVAVASATCHAAAIKWSIGGSIDASSGIDTSVGSFVLAYIGNTSGTGVDATTFNTEMAKGTASSYSIKDTGTWSDFYVSARGTYANARTLNTTGDVSGDTYQVFYKLNDSYFLVNDLITTAMVSVNAVSGEASVTPYVGGQSATGSVMYATGGARTAITSVPEPSTAALALAGLALLLKRRKA